MQERILVADDDASTRRAFERHLTEADFEVIQAKDGHETMAVMDEGIDLVLLDLYMPGPSGLEVLGKLREQYPDTAVIMVSGHAGVPEVVEAMKLGAFQYMVKPLVPEDLVAQVRIALRAVELERSNRELRTAVASPMPAAPVVTNSPASRSLEEQVRKLAELGSTVLITGESGTGKSTLARRIHQLSNRNGEPFVAVSCASLPRDLIEAELFGHERGAFTGAHETRPGRAEMAHGGTLFLDEIGDLPLELQPKLLTFLQDRSFHRIGSNTPREVDVRVITATNRDLKSLCQQLRFREDLYFRLNVLRLHVPPLRERAEDLEDLTESVLERIAAERSAPAYRLPPETMDRLALHAWPGNLRELENVLERASAFCSDRTITADLLDLEPAPSTHEAFGGTLAGRTLAEIEQQAILETLESCGGNKAAAARRLGVCEKTIYNKLKRLRVLGAV